jgi:hypothetical protein
MRRRRGTVATAPNAIPATRSFRRRANSPTGRCDRRAQLTRRPIICARCPKHRECGRSASPHQSRKPGSRRASGNCPGRSRHNPASTGGRRPRADRDRYRRNGAGPPPRGTGRARSACKSSPPASAPARCPPGTAMDGNCTEIGCQSARADNEKQTSNTGSSRHIYDHPPRMVG